jgi:hemerythrin-like metal-binding protein
MSTAQAGGHPSVGVKLLDRDHNFIEEIFSEIQFRAAAGLLNEQTGKLVRQLAQLMQVHFALEEGMMSSTHYPGSEIHQLRHQWMMEQIELLVTLRGRKEMKRNEELMKYLADSHRWHIRNDDLHYGLWLNTRALH